MGMFLSDEQMAAVNHGLVSQSAFEWVELPVGPKTLPPWAKGLHVDWMDDYGNSPRIGIKTNDDLRGWPNKRFRADGPMYLAAHEDGRAEVFGTGIRRFESSRPSQFLEGVERLRFPDNSDAPEQKVFVRRTDVGTVGSPTIAALYVAPDGTYANLPGVEVWDEARDARLYAGPHPVVAHPPCQLWTRFAHVNFARWGGEHNRPGNDRGCFAAALSAVKTWGGVLEHPAFSDAWKAFALPRPKPGRWLHHGGVWVSEVWHSAYGHKARKRTWLLYRGDAPPPEMDWSRPEGTHQIGFHDQRGPERNKPTISGRAASATPEPFRDALLSIARFSPAPLAIAGGRA